MIDVELPSKNRGKPLDALLVAKHDWANTGFRFWRCLQKLGLNSLMVKGEPHRFAYPMQAPIHPSLTSKPMSFSPCVVMAPGLESLLESAHVIHLIASTWPFVAFDWKERNVVVQHGGTAYRLDPDTCNATMDPYASATIIQCPDLLNLGASNEHLIYYPVDVDFINPDFKRRDVKRLVVGHFPSNSEIKGSKEILEVIDQLETDHYYFDKFNYVGVTNIERKRDWVSWEDNLKRMAKCDIIIETLAPKNYDHPFGEWGNTCLEAAALGKIVITNCLNLDIYSREYGHFAPCVANTPEDLKKTLMACMDMSTHEIAVKREQTRTWAEESHSIDATAKRLWNLVYKEFF